MTSRSSAQRSSCARHDECTPDGGLPSKACNRRLQVEAEGVAQNPSQPADLRALAGVVASGAAMMPSQQQRSTIAPAGASQNMDAPALTRPGMNTDAADDTNDLDAQ